MNKPYSVHGADWRPLLTGELASRAEAALDRIADATERAEAARALDERIHGMAPWVYLWHPVLEVATAPRLQGYRPHPISSAERWLEVELAEAPAR